MGGMCLNQHRERGPARSGGQQIAGSVLACRPTCAVEAAAGVGAALAAGGAAAAGAGEPSPNAAQPSVPVGAAAAAATTGAAGEPPNASQAGAAAAAAAPPAPAGALGEETSSRLTAGCPALCAAALHDRQAGKPFETSFSRRSSEPEECTAITFHLPARPLPPARGSLPGRALGRRPVHRVRPRHHQFGRTGTQNVRELPHHHLLALRQAEAGQRGKLLPQRDATLPAAQLCCRGARPSPGPSHRHHSLRPTCSWTPAAGSAACTASPRPGSAWSHTPPGSTPGCGPRCGLWAWAAAPGSIWPGSAPQRAASVQ